MREDTDSRRSLYEDIAIYCFSNRRQPSPGLTDNAIRPLVGQQERPCPRSPVRMSMTPPVAGASKKPCAVPASMETNTASHRNVFPGQGDVDDNADAQATFPLEGVIFSCAGKRERPPRVT